MRMVSIRVLRKKPGEFEAILVRERTAILNRDNGRIAVDVAEAPLEEILRLVTHLRAELAVGKMRSEAQERRLSQMTLGDIDGAKREVRGTRAE